jgi:hypothetical protein
MKLINKIITGFVAIASVACTSVTLLSTQTSHSITQAGVLGDSMIGVSASVQNLGTVNNTSTLYAKVNGQPNEGNPVV